MARWDGLCAWDQGSQKGALLWEEYRRRWLHLLKWFGFAAAFVGLAAMYVLPLGLFWGDPDVGWSMRAMLLLLAGLFVLIAVMIVTESIKTLPFRVYERGITKPYVSLRDGLDGRETFVPSEDVKEVTWETVYVPKGGPVQHFRFHLVDGTTFDISGKQADELSPWLLHVLPCPVEVPE